jgi:general secretion pathway protein J
VFVGESGEMRYAAALPARVSGGGLWYYRLAVAKEGERSRLILQRAVPDLDATALPEFVDADRSILAEDIGELRIAYFGRDAGAAQLMEPTWRESWDDTQRLPLLVRIEVVPSRGPAWPPLFVAPRQAPEAGCRQWDAAGERCRGLG